MSVKNPAVLQFARERPCCVCLSPAPSDPCHIKSRGAGGPDTFKNLVSMCRKCHREQHQKGIITFYRNHAGFRRALTERGWIFDGHLGRLYNGGLADHDGKNLEESFSQLQLEEYFYDD